MAKKETTSFEWDGVTYSVKFNPDDRRHEVQLPGGDLLQIKWQKVGDDPWAIVPKILLDPHEALIVE